MFLLVRPAVAPAVSLFLALLTVLAPGVVDVAQAQTVSLRFSSTMLAENGGTATVTATVAPPSTTPFTVDVSAVATVDSDPSMGRVTVSGTTLNFAANAMTSTGTVTITAIDNDGHTPQLRGGVIVTVSGTVTGGTGVTEPLDEELEIVEDDGIGTATDMTRPVMLMGSGAVEGDRVTLAFSEALKSDRTPHPVHFQVRIDGTIVRPRTVEVMGYRVFLTLREPVEPASAVSVGYNPPKHDNLDIDLTQALQDLAGIPVYATRQTSLDNDTKPSVELVLTPPSIDENGGRSVVTAKVPEASMTRFTVEVAVTPVAPATADDVTVSSNKVLIFEAGATESTGVVTIAAVDNGAEEDDLEVTVSGTLGAGASDVSEPMDLTLTILDDEAPSRPAQPTQPAGTASIQKPWLARFGRMTAQYVLDGVRQRLTAPRAAGLRGRLAGKAFNGTAPQPDRLRNVPGDAAASNPFRSRRVTDRDLLTGTAFALTGGTGGGGSFALWGQGGHSRLDGRDGPIRLDGTVTAATLGTDYSARRWLAGLALSHSRGEGSYRSGAEKGKLATSLTGAYPYVRYALTERLALWGAAGHGRGTLKVTRTAPARQPAAAADMSLSMAGAGGRGVLVPRKQRAGLELAVGADALYVRTTSEATAGLKGAEADVSRLLLRLEGSWVQPFRGGATLTPSLEIGARHDGGDAETGFGADVGGGIVLADPRSGFSLALNARGLLAHEASGFREWGVSGALRYDPDPVSERGLSLTLTPSWNAASTGGADALFGRETLAGLTRGETRRPARLGAEFAYGFPAFAGRFTGTPYLGLGLTQGGGDARIGWRLAAARRDDVDMTFGLEAARREYAGGDPEHTAGLRLTTRW